MKGKPPDLPVAAPLAADLVGGEQRNSLLDLVDHLLGQGVVANGELVLGLADVDLVYLRLSTLLCAADRVLPAAPRGEAPAAGAPASGPPSATPPEPLREAVEEPAVEEPAARKLAAQEPAARPLPMDPGDDVHALGAEELESLRGELEERLGPQAPARWNADPENAQKAVAKLVLTLVDFLRQLMERQAVRRMDAGTLDPDEVERVGMALMRLEETVHEMAARFGIPPEELNLDLGPLGRLT